MCPFWIYKDLYLVLTVSRKQNNTEYKYFCVLYACIFRLNIYYILFVYGTKFICTFLYMAQNLFGFMLPNNIQ